MSIDELLERARKRDQEYEQQAIEAERKGDAQLCWFYMAARAENKRFIDRLEAHAGTRKTPQERL